MPWNIRFVSTYPPRRCGIGTFSRDLSNALAQFTGEIGHIRVAAIDNDNGPYNLPVDMTIDQYNPQSWKNAIGAILDRAAESNNPTAVTLQHEFGLDPDDEGNNACGDNFVKMAKAFSEKGLTVLVYLHTVLEDPDKHQKKILQDLAEFSDGLIVTTESAINILESEKYGISPFKLKHIDHGIRMQHPTQYDRFKIKTELGLQDFFLATTLGLLSPAKGIQFGIQGFGKFLKESCTDAQRSHIVYLIAGQCHPEFVRSDGGSNHRKYMETLESALKAADVRWCKTANTDEVDWEENDVVFLDRFLSESEWLQYYGAANVMILPYMNMEQISSGILADTVGSGRIVISTKFRYALEVIHSNQRCPEGLVMGRFARGILVDGGEASIDQIAEALDFLVFEKGKRLRMEKQAHQRGYQMRWSNSAWALIQYIDFVSEDKEITTGRGVRFFREKKSKLQRQ